MAAINSKSEKEKLAGEIELIAGKARELGLDFFPVYFEICPAEIIYTFGAYGMPTRFAHWSFGKAFHRMKTQYEFNLSRIYELVINADPCYAFLLEGNTLLQNKLVAAHVFAHCDFFKHNIHFSGTNRQMVETMACNARRIREMEFKYGKEAVEKFIDAVMAIQEHAAPHRPGVNARVAEQVTGAKPTKPKFDDEAAATPYTDLWQLDDLLQSPENRPAQPAAASDNRQKGGDKSYARGNKERDLLLFLAQNARDLHPWQREILQMLREEMLYFRPQMETKIMNEGWASLWHLRIMREMDLCPQETIEFARMHAGILVTGARQLNPYLLGMKIFESIEANFGRMDQEAGRSKIFEVRETENDLSFIRNYLNEEIVEELDLYTYRKVGEQWVIVEKDWAKVRDNLVAKLVNCNIPLIAAEDSDYEKQGELYLKHFYEGVELDVRYLEKTLMHICYIWGRRVHLETVMNKQAVLYTADGKQCSSKRLA